MFNFKIRCSTNPEHKHFEATAHVTQGWKCDKNGNFEECLTTCEVVTHAPDKDDCWTCAECGAVAITSKI